MQWGGVAVCNNMLNSQFIMCGVYHFIFRHNVNLFTSANNANKISALPIINTIERIIATLAKTICENWTFFCFICT